VQGLGGTEVLKKQSTSVSVQRAESVHLCLGDVDGVGEDSPDDSLVALGRGETALVAIELL